MADEFTIPELDESMNVDDQLKKLELLRGKLEYQDLQMRVQNELTRRDTLKRQREQQQISLKKSDEDKAREQAICKHKKGGKDLAGVLKGNKPERSVHTHTFPWGETVVMCTRCGKEWWMPEADDPQYATKMAAYKEAREWETDNEPSGNQMFVIIDNTPKPPAAPKPDKAAIKQAATALEAAEAKSRVKAKPKAKTGT